MPTCNRIGCTADATQRPAMSFNGHGDRRESTRAKALIALVVCDTHAVAEDFKPDEEGWRIIDAHLHAKGLRAADRSTLRIDFEALP